MKSMSVNPSCKSSKKFSAKVLLIEYLKWELLLIQCHCLLDLDQIVRKLLLTLLLCATTQQSMQIYHGESKPTASVNITNTTVTDLKLLQFVCFREQLRFGRWRLKDRRFSCQIHKSHRMVEMRSVCGQNWRNLYPYFDQNYVYPKFWIKLWRELWI